MFEHAALADAGGLVRPLELDRDLGLDLLIEAHLEAIQMHHLAADRVMLLLLDHDGNGLRALQLEVEQRVALAQQDSELASGNLERPGVATLAVDDTRHQAIPAQPAG